MSDQLVEAQPKWGAAVVGAGSNGPTFFRNWAGAAQRSGAGSSPLVYSQHLMDIAEPREIARAKHLALSSPVSHRTFNIASMREASQLEVAVFIAAAMSRTTMEPFRPAPTDRLVSRRLSELSAAQVEPGGPPSMSLERGLDDPSDAPRVASTQ